MARWSAPDPNRDAQMVDMRRNGCSLEEIGQAFGVTRERVRQILDATPGAPSKEELAARTARAKAADLAYRQRTVRDDLEANPGSTVAEVAVRTGLSEAEVRASTIASHRRFLIKDAKPGSRQRQWTEGQAIAAIRAAGRVESPLRTTTYERLVQDGEVSGPSVPLLYQRFGGWRLACERAGVTSAPPLRKEYGSNWSDAELLELVCDYLEGEQAHGTYADFEQWLDAQPGAPSGPTVRIRLGQWNDVKRTVFQSIWVERRSEAGLGNARSISAP